MHCGARKGPHGVNYFRIVNLLLNCFFFVGVTGDDFSLVVFHQNHTVHLIVVAQQFCGFALRLLLHFGYALGKLFFAVHRWSGSGFGWAR